MVAVRHPQDVAMIIDRDEGAKSAAAPVEVLHAVPDLRPTVRVAVGWLREGVAVHGNGPLEQGAMRW